MNNPGFIECIRSGNRYIRDHAQLFCRNGGQCFVRFGSGMPEFICKCAPNFHGIHCDYPYYSDVYRVFVSKMDASNIALLILLVMLIFGLVGIIFIWFCYNRRETSQTVCTSV